MSTNTLRTKSLRLAGVALALVALASLGVAEVVAQDLHPSRRPSPMGQTFTDVGDAWVQVVYGRPYLRGRENIFGTADSEALVPFGEVWRTGANEATTVTVTGDVMVGDQTLPAGTYTLFTVPGESQWTVHFNSALGLWGTMGRNPETGQFENMFSADKDVLVHTASVGSPEETVDQLTMAFEEAEGGGSHLVISWADTEVRVPFKPAG